MITPRRSTTASLALAAVLSATAGTALPAQAADGHGSTPGRCSAAVALSGSSDHLDETVFGGSPVAGLSALAPTAEGELLALSDRSALFTLDGATRTPTGVVALRDADGAELDSEGLVVDRDGTLWISSEVGPAVLHYDRGGTLLGQLEVPADLQLAPAGRARGNLSLEGLTLSADGLTLFAADEQELTGDADGVVRVQSWHRADPGAPFAPGPQFAHRTDPGLGVPEITATPDGRLLVLEREFIDQVGNTVRLYVVDPVGAPDTSGVETVDEESTQELVVPKTLLADLVTCPSAGAVAEQPQLNPLLDNVEGMAVLSAQGERHLRLLLVSDDNERPTQTTRLYDLDVTLPVLQR
ncbi:esterase-like activity of phytase family protein [Kineococcus sp. SYSU DK006]|uniref:esterase-like activity of phytase family protein n=1 Tax=Kineococcus sp. SYSU DK006 TaxID=3383127 RepID=UPI003D7F0E31